MLFLQRSESLACKLKKSHDDPVSKKSSNKLKFSCSAQISWMSGFYPFTRAIKKFQILAIFIECIHISKCVCEKRGTCMYLFKIKEQFALYEHKLLKYFGMPYLNKFTMEISVILSMFRWFQKKKTII